MQQALGALASLVVTIFIVKFLIKRYQPQVVLFVGGLVLMLFAVFLGAGPAEILPGKVKSTGFIGFDLFKFIERTLSARVAGLGLIIMSAGGYATYMDKIGASKVMVDALIKPLSRLKAPYLMMSLAFLVGVFLKMFIASASGLAMLLMVTIYPVIVALGASSLSAATMVVLCGGFGIGPGSGNANLAATNSGLDIMEYFISYQMPVAMVSWTTAAVLLFFTQRYYDKKEKLGKIYGNPTEEKEVKTAAVVADNSPPAPKYYIILPTIPLTLLMVFSPYGIKSCRVDVVTAMLISMAISLACECIRHRNAKEVFKNFMVIFEFMGRMFARVLTLIVAGETFAKGLMATGTVDLFISSAQNAGFGPVAMILLMTLVMVLSSVLMGSANASFFSFAALAPKIAKELSFPAVKILLPMQLASGMGRITSPISAVVVAVAGVSGESPFDIVRRIAIPAAGTLAVMVASSLIFY